MRPALEGLSASVQALALQFVAAPYDSVRLRHVDGAIDAHPRLARLEREVLKQFVRVYGRRERKRPRDRLLRDPRTRRAVLEVRRQTAFLGYTWRRRRPNPYMLFHQRGLAAAEMGAGAVVAAGGGLGAGAAEAVARMGRAMERGRQFSRPPVLASVVLGGGRGRGGGGRVGVLGQQRVLLGGRSRSFL